jgi:hypothetical protein
MAEIRYWTDENGWRRVDFNYFLTKTKGKMIVKIEDGEKSGEGVLLHLGSGAVVQILPEQDGVGINYMTP